MLAHFCDTGSSLVSDNSTKVARKDVTFDLERRLAQVLVPRAARSHPARAAEPGQPILATSSGRLLRSK